MSLYFLPFNCSLHLGIQSGPCEDELIRLDEAYIQNKYKVSDFFFFFFFFTVVTIANYNLSGGFDVLPKWTTD
mgnify:CR=1 FL=1